MQEQRIKGIILAITAVLCLITYLITSNSIKRAKQEERSLKQKYYKVLALYQKIQSNKRKIKKFSKDPIMLVSMISNRMGLKDKLISSNTFETPKGKGIHIRLSKLNLNQVVTLLDVIEQYSDLEIVGLQLKKNVYKKDLLDMELKIVRRNSI
ncbi:conserved hypothetical protein [Thermosulfidibacter takaii ABI70S6]|uniref:General secretion pathway protein M n=1 Tax=Thermosulfidibacter takaii (strain DSM 17441 / JCM 13301 / NBRC 103674 / ABI70S6) TaxID=1298851 RepID=A0A0S3QV57_THET7|nr:hypothetical protein [Thermosulfidibacter takaii]BAT72186.1 conserved hypothetical protein [Thermosulfidibacter takaii ABI70S6]